AHVHSSTRRCFLHSFVFSCLSYGLPRALHSFPTRRSSDLLGLISHLESDLYENAVVPIALAHRYTAISFQPGGRVLDLLTKHALDRKSTRLNSSHVKISYAVFCLKQKNCQSAKKPLSRIDP